MHPVVVARVLSAKNDAGVTGAGGGVTGLEVALDRDVAIGRGRMDGHSQREHVGRHRVRRWPVLPAAPDEAPALT